MAQYLLGKSLVYGEGCIADKTKGIEWLIRSASSGQRYSKELLGIVAAENTDHDSHIKAKRFFSELEEMSTYPKLRYAWLLATSSYKDISDPELAIDLVESIKENEFNDPVTIYEIKAAAYAAKGNFSKAISNQEDALDEAEDRNIDLSDLLKNLDLYKSNKSISIGNI